MSKTAIQNQSQKLGGDCRGNQNAGQGQDACQKHQFSGIRHLALTTPEFGQDAELPYDGSFPSADQLFEEYGLDTLDKIKAEIRSKVSRYFELDLTICSLDYILGLFDDEDTHLMSKIPASADFVAVSTWQDQMFRVAKTERDHWLTTMITRYSVLPVWSAVSILDDDEDRYFYDEEYSKDQFLSEIPELMRTPINDPARKFFIENVTSGAVCHAGYIMSNYPSQRMELIAGLVESCQEYCKLEEKTEGFFPYDFDGVVPAICIMTKPEDQNGICPVRRLYDDECEMAGQTNTGGLLGWALISHDFSANERGLFKQKLECFLRNADLTLKIAREIGK